MGWEDDYAAQYDQQPTQPASSPSPDTSYQQPPSNGGNWYDQYAASWDSQPQQPAPATAQPQPDYSNMINGFTQGIQRWFGQLTPQQDWNNPWDYAANTVQNVVGTGLDWAGQVFSQPGKAVDWLADKSNIPGVSQLATGARGIWENTLDPAFNALPAVVGYGATALTDPSKAWEQLNTTFDPTQYYQNQLANYQAGGMSQEDAAYRANRDSEKYKNPFNAAEVAGNQKFGTLPAIAQLGTMLIDPLGNKVAEATIGRGIGAAGKVAGKVGDVTGLSDVAGKVGEALQSPQQIAARYGDEVDRLTPVIQELSDAKGVPFAQTLEQFANDADFRAQLGYTGKGGDQIAAAAQEIYASKAPQTVANPELTDGGKNLMQAINGAPIKDTRFADQLDQHQAQYEKARYYDEIHSNPANGSMGYEEALKEPLFNDALTKAQQQTRDAFGDIQTPQDLGNFRQANPAIAEAADVIGRRTMQGEV